MGQGTFIWHELMTAEAEAAEAFYSHVVGWTTQDSGQTGFKYTLLMTEGVPVGGLMAMPVEACANGARPAWMGSIGVEDVDATVAAVERAGGAVIRPATDIPGVGRFAVIADPQGAKAVLLHLTWSAPAQAVAAPTPGTVGWNELHVADWTAVFPFYETVFGWTKDQAVDMGAMGTYQLFAAGGRAIGGMMSEPPGGTVSGWLYYFCVDAVDAAVARVTERGGTLCKGPHPVPGGAWIAHCLDPQGVPFAVTAATR